MRSGLVGAILLFLGVVLLLTAFLVGWYSWNLSGSATSGTITGSFAGTVTFNLGNTLQVDDSLSAFGISVSNSSSETYSHANLTSTGALYEASQYLVLVGILLGFVAGVFAVLPGNRLGIRRGAMAFGIAALLLALAVPVTLAVAQPGALHHDKSKANSITGVPANVSTNATGPWNSYFGSCASEASCLGITARNTSGTSVSESWGPGAGWYLSLVAFVFLLLGVLFFRRGRASAAPAYPPSGLPYYYPTAPGTVAPPASPGSPTSWPPGPSAPPVPPPAPGWPPSGPG